MRLMATLLTAAAIFALFACVTIVNAAAQQSAHRATRGEHCKRSCPVSQGWRCIWWQRLWAANPTPAQVKRCAAEFFQSVPQEHVVDTVKNDLLRKVEDPKSSAVYFFVGDNGVGKTYVAGAISLILSPCPDDTSKRGNTVFEVDCMAISSGSKRRLGKRRASLIDSLIAHMKGHPNAVFILNEVHMLGDSLDLLTPLVSGTQYPNSDVKFDTATVIMTMDLSDAGGTEHLSINDVTAATYKELERWPHDVASAIRDRARIVPFPPFGLEGYEMVIRYLLNRLPCREHWIDSLSFTPREVTVLALSAFTGHRHDNSNGNGRAAAKVVEDVLDEFKSEVRDQISQARRALREISGQVLRDQPPQRNGEEALPRCDLRLIVDATGLVTYHAKIL